MAESSSSQSESKDILVCRECVRCGEVMSVIEKVCYCSGTLRLITLGKEHKEYVYNYASRKWIYKMRNK